LIISFNEIALDGRHLNYIFEEEVRVLNAFFPKMLMDKTSWVQSVIDEARTFLICFFNVVEEALSHVLDLLLCCKGVVRFLFLNEIVLRQSAKNSLFCHLLLIDDPFA